MKDLQYIVEMMKSAATYILLKTRPQSHTFNECYIAHVGKIFTLLIFLYYLFCSAGIEHGDLCLLEMLYPQLFQIKQFETEFC